MRFIINFNHFFKLKNILCESIYTCWINTINLPLHAYIMAHSLCLNYIFKLHDVISTCFVLNMSGYGGHDIKANFTFMNYILGQFIKPMILNVMATHDEQNSEVYTSTEEDQQNPSSRNLQSTPKTIFKWSN